jgi:hypothetical protein
MMEHTNPKSSLFKTLDKGNKISLLRELYLSDSKRKFPSVPDFARSVATYSDKTANGLTKCIIDFIRFKGGQVERINCTGRVIDNRKTSTDIIGNQRTIGSLQYIKTAGQRGTADISATIKGRSVKIEVKIGADKQSEAQRQYQRSIEESGGLYIIAKNFNQFYTWYILTFGGENYGR